MSKRLAFLITILALLPVLGACEESPTEPEPDEEMVAAVFQIGDATRQTALLLRIDESREKSPTVIA